jgi:hypothetical protein
MMAESNCASKQGSAKSPPIQGKKMQEKIHIPAPFCMLSSEDYRMSEIVSARHLYQCGGLLAVFLWGIAPEAIAAIPGQEAALSRETTEGRRIEVEGPPSPKRHPGLSDPQRMDNSADGAHPTMQARRDLPDGVYQSCRKKWLTTRFPTDSLDDIAAKVRAQYEDVVLSRVQWPNLTRIEVEPMTLVYPARYASNQKPMTIHARRITLHAVDAFGDERHIVAYYLNYDKVSPTNSRVVLQVNGHFGLQPSRMNLGLKGRGGITGSAVAMIALEGHPIITYDDHNVGESSPAAYKDIEREIFKEPGLYRTLANLRMVEDALLLHFDRVDAIGLSGGTERLYHFLTFNRCPIYSVYFSGFFSSTWMNLDSKRSGRGPFGTNLDTHDEAYLEHFQRADHALVAIANGVDVRFAIQTYEGDLGKNCFVHEFLPVMKQYTDRFSVGSDDPDCDGISNDGSEMAHEYHLPDYYAFLERSLARPIESDELVLLCRAVPPSGLAFVDLDLTKVARLLGLLPLTFSRLRTVANVPAQFIPSPDFNPHTNVRGRALVRFPRGGDHRLELHAGPGREMMPKSWDGVVDGRSFTLRHGAKAGGFPVEIQYKRSGKVYDTIRFNDRVHSSDVGSFHLRNDAGATMEKLSDGPLATVIRTSAEYIQDPGKRAGVDAVYDWIYLHDQPTIRVDASLMLRREREWAEAHVLEINFPDESFTRWMGGEPFQEDHLKADKVLYGSSSWAALLNESDAMAIFECGKALVYDGRGEYGTYLHAHGNGTWQAWSQDRRSFTASMWLGAADDARSAVTALAEASSGQARSTVSLKSLESELAKRTRKLAGMSGGEKLEAEFVIRVARRWIDQGRAVEALRFLEENDMSRFLSAEAGDLRITFDTGADGLVLQSLRDAKTGLEFLAPDNPPLFTLKVREVDSGKEVELQANSGWGDVRAERRADDIVLHWSSPAQDGLEALSVSATAAIDAAGSALRWKIKVRNETVGWTLLHAVFPQVSVADLGRDGCLFFPRAPGEVEVGIWGKSFKHSGLYPEPWTTMQYLAAYPADGRSGLYIAAHDPSGSPKRITIESHPDRRSVAWTYENPAADMSLRGNDYETIGEVVWQVFRGDWFDAAVLYRDWVRENARWYPLNRKAGETRRDDTPRWMRELPVWVNKSGPFPEVVERTKAFAKRMGVPVGLHWYSWHQIPFDNDYPHYFPAGEGFAEHVTELQKAGVFVMPYINGRLWDTRDKGAEDFEFTKIALPAATKDEEGHPYVESYGSTEEDGSKVVLAVMCPATEVWQERVGEICRRLFEECGVDGVYIDQIAAMSPRMCMDPRHGHPLGGGTWWNEGYWKMLGAIRDKMPEGAMLTSECNSEPFAQVFDGYLSWTWQHDGQVPAFMVVYGGAIQLFGRQYGGTTQAKRMKVAQQFVFGEQIGWMSPEMIHEDEGTTELLRQCVQLRWKLKQYFAEGEMARPPKLTGDVPQMTADWAWGGQKNWLVTAETVFAGAWRIPSEGKTVLLFANASEDPVTAKIDFNANEYGLKTDSFTRREVVIGKEAADDAKETLTIQPLQARAFEYGAE